MECDVAIVGGGPVGGSLARALETSGLSVALVEPRAARPLPDAGFDQRVYALNGASRSFLERCGIWQHMQHQRVAPVREMRVFGDDASEIEFSAYRQGVPELAAIVEEANLQQALQARLSFQTNLTVYRAAQCTGVRWEEAFARLALSDGTQITARLVVAADGADSAVRTAAGIEAQVSEYAQTGVVANFHAQAPHRDTAYQWFLRNEGVLALLPLPGNHVSMVWSAPHAHAQTLLASNAEELSRTVQDATSDIFGQLRSISAPACFALRRLRTKRLIGPRLALVGDTAHNVHPLAGQGLNLGFGDAQALAAVLAARGLEGDSGAQSILRRYERRRREDLAAMEFVTHSLHALFDSTLPGIRGLRNAGLQLAGRIPALKRMLVKRALG